MAHLGLGAFHRAHQAWFTEVANRCGGEQWGVAAFTGRRPDAARALRATGCRYDLVVRGPDADRRETVSAVVEAHDGADAVAWRRTMATVAVLTVTVTEAGYLDDEARDAEDVRALAAGRLPRSPAARIVDGLRARLATGGGGMAVVACDNLDSNGALLGRRVGGLAGRLDPDLADWIGDEVSFVSSVVDRITPAPTDEGLVTEPHASWVLAGDFPAGRPAWEVAGALFVDDVRPYEQRKLWLLNAGHSLLALTGLPRGHRTVADAMRDPECVAQLGELWDGLGPVLPFTPDELDRERESVTARFANARIEHSLAQIAVDSALKLGIRVLPVVEERRRRGLDAGRGQLRTVAAWAAAVRGGLLDGPDLPGSPADLATSALRHLSSSLADDPDVVAELAELVSVPDPTGTPR
ncbi:mannitol dehydrogenase family protein [Phycicoccus sp. BSK3Z-2]|uniref:Mannitol-1-phosphate 5-dehydrogenase n=1 Tax=Phycicoccus avicenniae TaxID=2828860 RepID=A0A941D713_9MICO|nr:mannitol dehydrogenase family protein [Phycicoccus avicenniae]MBR7741707.1 mannitol dehydrogenase family protein [Phycicoccus avicenniae]